MQTPKILWMGAKKTLNQSQAIEEYVILRIRFEEIKRLDYLLQALYHKRIALPGSPGLRFRTVSMMDYLTE